jgi:hypothetical protein
LDLVDLISRAKPTTSQTDNPSQIGISLPRHLTAANTSQI